MACNWDIFTFYLFKIILKRGQYLFQNTSMVVYTLIRVVRWSVFLWCVATRCVFNNSVSDFVDGLVVFIQLTLLRLLSSLVNVDNVNKDYNWGVYTRICASFCPQMAYLTV
jgi:hypothetical protein